MSLKRVCPDANDSYAFVLSNSLVALYPWLMHRRQRLVEPSFVGSINYSHLFSYHAQPFDDSADFSSSSLAILPGASGRPTWLETNQRSLRNPPICGIKESLGQSDFDLS